MNKEIIMKWPTYPDNKPEHKGYYLVTCVGGVVVMDAWFNGKNFTTPIIAWMKKPPPYSPLKIISREQFHQIKGEAVDELQYGDAPNLFFNYLPTLDDVREICEALIGNSLTSSYFGKSCRYCGGEYSHFKKTTSHIEGCVVTLAKQLLESLGKE